jgi:hypothetical protein
MRPPCADQAPAANRSKGPCNTVTEVRKSPENQSGNQFQYARRALSFLAPTWRQRLYSTLTGIWRFGTWGKGRAVSLFGSHPSVLIPMLSQRLRGFGFSLS